MVWKKKSKRRSQRRSKRRNSYRSINHTSISKEGTIYRGASKLSKVDVVDPDTYKDVEGTTLCIRYDNVLPRVEEGIEDQPRK